MIFAFDIDGVLTIETEGFGELVYSSRTPNLENISIVNCLFSKGHQITLFTSRYSEDLVVTTNWLKKYNVNYHSLLFDKPKYDLLIDDKCINVKDINNVFKNIS